MLRYSVGRGENRCDYITKVEGHVRDYTGMVFQKYIEGVTLERRMETENTPSKHVP